MLIILFRVKLVLFLAHNNFSSQISFYFKNIILFRVKLVFLFNTV